MRSLTGIFQRDSLYFSAKRSESTSCRSIQRTSVREKVFLSVVRSVGIFPNVFVSRASTRAYPMDRSVFASLIRSLVVERHALMRSS